MVSFYLQKTIKFTFAERLFAVAVLAVTLQLSFPQYSHAAVAVDRNPHIDFSNALVVALMQGRDESIASLPEPIIAVRAQGEEARVAISESPRRTMWVLVTAYSSTPDQTDGSPYITAKNTFVRDGVVAANFLPFNTRLRIPKYFGDKEFVVEDRMHERFSNRIDIWMTDKARARQWGARWVKVEIL